MIPNPEKTAARVALIIAVGAGVLIFVPGWAGIDGMKGGYALSFVSIWVAISAALIAWFFWRRAVQLDRLLGGQDVLAHWTYTQAEWQAFAGTEMKEKTSENWGLWFVMAVMCLGLGIIFWLIDHEAGLYVFLAMVGMTLILAAAAFSFPRLRRQLRTGRMGEAWIGSAAVFFDGDFYPWNSWMMRLEKVVLRPAGESPACLEFHLYHLTRTSLQNQTLRIPVPAGRTDEALEIVSRYKKKKR